jgi:DNA-binding NarL/FixJ family response regulator
VVVIDPSSRAGEGHEGVRALARLRERVGWFLLATHVSADHRFDAADALACGADLHLLKGLPTAELVTALLHGLRSLALDDVFGDLP